MKKLIKFMNEAFDVVEAIKESKQDNGRIGLFEWVNIGRELADVVKLIPTIKDFPVELKEATPEQIQELANEIYQSISNLDTSVMNQIRFVAKEDMVSLLTIIGEITSIVKRHKK